MRKLTTEEFIVKAKGIHKDKYDYSKVDYINMHTKVIIICPIHGEFTQDGLAHLRGDTCKKCNGLIRGIKKIQEFKAIHLDKYTYDKVVYLNTKTNILITCPIHGDFKQKPENHLKGSGCPSCAGYGFDINKPAILYYLKITTNSNRILYKIGITNNSVNERFTLKELERIEIVKQKLYENGTDAYNWEQRLLAMYKQYQYVGPNILVSGNTELFTEDIIAMYYKQFNI